MSRTISFHLAAIALVGALASPLHADVIEHPGAYSKIQFAINAAQPGDVILVAPGIYVDQIVIPGKGISLVGDGGKVTLPQVRVQSVPAGQTVVLRNITALGSNLPSSMVMDRVGLILDQVAGFVRAEDCTFAGSYGLYGSYSPYLSPTDGFGGVRIKDCNSVVLVNCAVYGGGGASIYDEDEDPAVTDGGAAMHIRTSNVAAYNCTFSGGIGGSIYDTKTSYGGNGGTAVINKATLHLSGSTLSGGDGGSSECDYFGCGLGGSGGNGLQQDGALAVASLRDNVYLPGTGGLDGDGMGWGPPGQTMVITAGASATFPELQRDFFTDSPTREGQSLILNFDLQPGDTGYLWASLGPGHTPLWSRQGLFLLDLTTLFLVQLPLAQPAGPSTLPLPVPNLPTGIENLDVFLQLVVQTPASGFVLGPASVSTLLDSAF